ncbi:MAG: hypothetical protein ACOC0A_01035 [Planctomycetota bacterium]
MKLDDQEQKILNDYLSTAERPHKTWIALLVLGSIFCLSAVIILLFSHLLLSFSLLLLVTGLVTVAWGCEQRNKLIAAQILHQYHETLEEIKKHSLRGIGFGAPEDSETGE